MGRSSHQFVANVVDGTYLMGCTVGTCFPPFVEWNAVTVRIRSRSNCGVAGRGNQVPVVVIAISEVSPLLEKHVPSVLSLERCAISIKVISTELVEDEDDDKFRFRVVGVRPRSLGYGQKQRQQ